MDQSTSSWHSHPGDLDLWQPDTWYKGSHCHKFPQDRPLTIDDVILGWVPDKKLITQNTKVMAFGSYFAEYFIQFLAAHGFNEWQLPNEEDPHCDTNLLLSLALSFENIFVIVQHIRWAFGEFNPVPNLWFTTEKRHFVATEGRRAKARRSFEEADVVVITLGLSEVWVDQVANEPMWRTIPSRLYDPQRHVSKRATVAETLAALYEFDSLVDRFIPGKHFIFTLSPIPFVATFRNQSVVTANQVSKAVLRAALDEFITNPSIKERGCYHYFPSYELVFSLFDQPFMPDNHHIRREVVDTVLNIFSTIYTTLSSSRPNIPARDGLVQTLNAELRRLQDELIEKEKIIRELDAAARERLLLIQRLSGQT